MEYRLLEEKELFRVTIQSIGDGVITTDMHGNVTMLNIVAEQLTGWTQNDAIGVPFDIVFRIIHEKTRMKHPNPVREIIATGCTLLLHDQSVLISKSNKEYNIAYSGAPIMDAEGNILGVALVVRDVTEEKKQRDEILHISYHDNLTGLYNRAYFEKSIEKHASGEALPISIIMGDLNGLKLVNDIFGHYEGDRLIKTVATVLKKCCRKDDVISRWGGDEFAIILPQTSYEEVQYICDNIKKTCEENMELTLRPNIAIGFATKTETNQKLLSVIKKAEDLMYQNKLFESRTKNTGVVSTLQRTLNERSSETIAYAKRMVELSMMLGQEIGLSEDDLHDLKLVASLHDIGKVVVSSEVLCKTGKLTQDEWEKVKRHSEIGYRITQYSTDIAHISDYILFHHERWDGTGYPQGKRGEEIPLIARVISIVDAFDVMTNKRPYKKQMTSEEALNEIKECAGTQFDPNLVNIFKKLIINGTNNE